MKKKEILFLGILFLILFLINYSWLDAWFVKEFSVLRERESARVLRVIDGDTIETDLGSVRLLGINSPERGEEFYEEAKGFLEGKILNKTIELEYGKEKKDLYDRILAYVFYEENVNLELIEEGFANFYFLEDKTYYEEFYNAWEKCLVKGKNLCERSFDVCGNCIFLKKLDYENEIIVFLNLCDFECNLSGWSIKDEGRKKFVFPDFILEKNEEVEIIVSKTEMENTPGKIYWVRGDYVWTDTGDTLFLRDKENKLVLWENY